MARKRDKEIRDRRPEVKNPRGDTRLPLEKHAFWIALAGLVLLLGVFFAPLVVGGKTFLPPDELASRAHGPFLEDSFAEEAPLLDRYPQWTPYLFSGMPSYGSLMAAPYTNP